MAVDGPEVPGSLATCTVAARKLRRDGFVLDSVESRPDTHVFGLPQRNSVYPTIYFSVTTGSFGVTANMSRNSSTGMDNFRIPRHNACSRTLYHGRHQLIEANLPP